MAPIPFLSLRKSNVEPLAVSMSGVRMGERALQVGIDDSSLAGAIAVKVGLSGHAAIAVTSPAHEALAPSNLEGAAGVAALREIHRALRSGGRVLVIEGGSPQGVLRRRTPPPASSRLLDTLQTSGFGVTRLLAEREGYRFLEALKG
jgi:hypothetical protein